MTEDPVNYGSEETKKAKLDRLLAELETLNEMRTKLIAEIGQIVEEWFLSFFSFFGPDSLRVHEALQKNSFLFVLKYQTCS